MSSISSISSVSSLYTSIASGTSLNSAADGAAELTIAEEENAQITGYEVGNDNIASAQSLLNISDSALSSITDYLQSLRELALQAQNSALYSSSDLAALQEQANQYLQGIQDVTEQTTYNTQNLLDGTNTSYSIATDANGNGTTVTTTNATLDALGLTDLDITSADALSTIDSALESITSSRSSIGAQSNALEYAYNYNSYTAYNLTSAVSNIEDTDYPQAVEELKKKQAQQAYALMMQKKKMENEETKFKNFFA